MRTVAFASFGFALAVGAFALTGAQSLAVEAPSLKTTVQSNVTKVGEREEHERCDRVRRDCRERHHGHEREYRECVARERCE